MSTVSVFYHRPRGSFYARVYIPISIRSYFKGRIQCWRSLGTKDKQRAGVKATLWNSRVQQLFYTLALKGQTMNTSQIDALIARWMLATLDMCEEIRCTQLPTMSDDALDGQWYGLSEEFDRAHGALIAGDYKSVKHDVEELLTTHKLPLLDPESPAYARLARELLKAKQRVFQMEMERWNGDYSTEASETISAPREVTTPPPAPTKLFSNVVALYLTEHHTRSAKTQALVASISKTFLKTIGGDRAIGEITKSDCQRYKAHLSTAKLKAASTNKYLKALSHCFRWAKGQGFVADTSVNPVEGLLIAQSIEKKDSLKRTLFTAEQLRRVVEHPIFQRSRTAHPERYWIVLLCLYAGLRREEAAQLLVAQVVQDHDTGIWYLDICADKAYGQSLKNESSTRRVPLHSSLIAPPLDFLTYVTKTKKAGRVRLFWQCNKTASGYGDKAGQWFGRLLHTTLKLPNTLVLHSLRHGWITGLHAAAIPDQLVFALCGHTAAGGEVHARYTHRETFPLTLLSNAVNKLNFGLPS